MELRKGSRPCAVRGLTDASPCLRPIPFVPTNQLDSLAA
jgi:hypothetical protein